VWRRSNWRRRETGRRPVLHGRRETEENRSATGSTWAEGDGGKPVGDRFYMGGGRRGKPVGDRFYVGNMAEVGRKKSDL